MPIPGVTDKHWYPRLNKIRLGLKKQGQKGPYPAATDYFVCPPEVQKIYGEKPTELDVMFPSEKIELIAPAWYKCYSFSQGKICQGDGNTSFRKVDTDTGDFAGKETKHWTLAEAECDPAHCPMMGDKQCRKMMSLLFLLPKVPGIGVYQLDTGSYYSIRNIYSMLDSDPEHEGFIRHFTRGRISSLPLKLSVGPQEVITPDAGRKTVYVLNVRSDLILADQIKYSLKSAAQVLLPTLDDNEPPDDLYPEEVLQDGERQAADSGSFDSPEHSTGTATPVVPTTATAEKPVTWEQLGRTQQQVQEAEAARKAKESPAKISKQLKIARNSSKEGSEWDKVTQKDVPGYIELELIYCRLTGKSNRDMYIELGGGSRADQAIPAWDAFLGLKETYCPKDRPE